MSTFGLAVGVIVGNEEVLKCRKRERGGGGEGVVSGVDGSRSQQTAQSGTPLHRLACSVVGCARSGGGATR